MKQTPTPAKTRGRGRPAEFERERAIEAAMQLLWEKGFPAVSASQLADSMGIQRSSFYNSFGSRGAVYREALDRFARMAPDAPLDRVQPGESATALLATVFRRVCAARAADPLGRGCLVCTSVASMVGVDEELGPLLEQAVKQRISAVERLLHQAAADEELPTSSATTATAQSIVAFLMGLNSLSKIVREEDQLWMACRNYLAGLGISEQTLRDADRLEP